MRFRSRVVRLSNRVSLLNNHDIVISRTGSAKSRTDDRLWRNTHGKVFVLRLGSAEHPIESADRHGVATGYQTAIPCRNDSLWSGFEITAESRETLRVMGVRTGLPEFCRVSVGSIRSGIRKPVFWLLPETGGTGRFAVRRLSSESCHVEDCPEVRQHESETARASVMGE